MRLILSRLAAALISRVTLDSPSSNSAKSEGERGLN